MEEDRGEVVDLYTSVQVMCIQFATYIERECSECQGKSFFFSKKYVYARRRCAICIPSAINFHFSATHFTISCSTLMNPTGGGEGEGDKREAHT